MKASCGIPTWPTIRVRFSRRLLFLGQIAVCRCGILGPFHLLCRLEVRDYGGGRIAGELFDERQEEARRNEPPQTGDEEEERQAV